MKKVLVLYYSQSGQLRRCVDAFVKPLLLCPDTQVDIRAIKPLNPYPYPWPFYTFFDIFPEAVYLDGCENEELDIESSYDLVVLGYTTWFLAPSIPITGFLKSKESQDLLKDTPVVTLIACRDMWVMAQEKMKALLKERKANLVDSVVVTDQGRSLYTFVTTPRWLFTGKKDRFWFFPPAGVAQEKIDGLSRFGEKICSSLKSDSHKQTMFKGMGAVSADGKLIATEKIATKSFKIWGAIIKKAGKPGTHKRKVVITIYTLFLILMILTVVPLNILIRSIVQPWRKKSIEKEVRYFEKPSGA